MIWFTSDLHFQHKNICRGTSKWPDQRACRDFETTEDMDEAILKSINELVSKDDILYVLGDFSFGDKTRIPELRNRIDCRTIHLVYGNHDDCIRTSVDFQSCFSSCREYLETKLEGINGIRYHTVLFHYYIGGVWNKAQKGSFHLFGHSHGSLGEFNEGRSLDVGWDIWRRPLNEHELVGTLNNIPIHTPKDHHTKETNYG